MTKESSRRGFTRIQTRKRSDIFSAALEVFSKYGYRGSSLEQVAVQADLSKQNILYYFDNKQAIFVELIQQLMDLWLEPLAQIEANGDPVEEILNYVRRKLKISQNYPRESRLFANEILQGSPNIEHLITGRLKSLVDEKAAVIQTWTKEERIPDVDPYELLYSIWATTQHYADFSVQISLIRELSSQEQFKKAEEFLIILYTSLLTKSA